MHHYAVIYADMPNKSQQIHPLMVRLPAALRARMEALGHTQNDVATLTGVGQPQISRVLRGERKRLSPAMTRLCRYADIETIGREEYELQQLFERLISSGPVAEECVRGVLRGLEPLLAMACRERGQ